MVRVHGRNATTTTGADGKARRGTRYEHASSVLSALALLSELSREREHRWSFEGFRATPTPYHTVNPCLTLGSTRVLQCARAFPLTCRSHPGHKDVPHHRKHRHPRRWSSCALAPLRAQSNPVEFRHARQNQLRISTDLHGQHAALKMHIDTYTYVYILLCVCGCMYNTGQ